MTQDTWTVGSRFELFMDRYFCGLLIFTTANKHNCASGLIVGSMYASIFYLIKIFCALFRNYYRIPFQDVSFGTFREYFPGKYTDNREIKMLYIPWGPVQGNYLKHHFSKSSMIRRPCLLQSRLVYRRPLNKSIIQYETEWFVQDKNMWKCEFTANQ